MIIVLDYRSHRFLAPLLAERAQIHEPGAAQAAFKHLVLARRLDPNSEASLNDFALALLKVQTVPKHEIAQFCYLSSLNLIRPT